MVKLNVSIAGISIEIHMEDCLESLTIPFKKLFGGFLHNKDKSNVILMLSCDPYDTCPELDALPVNLREKNLPEYKEIINKIIAVYPISADALVVGCLNGCLAYNRHSGKGYMLFFRTKGKNYIVSSFYKLMFIFAALIMAEQGKLMIHGAGIVENEAGYLFLGESGAGKTTVSGFSEKKDVLSDDSPAVGRENDYFYIYSSPFSQVNLFGTQVENHYVKKAQLHKIFFLIKCDELFLKKREMKAAMAEILMKHVHAFEFMGGDSRTAAFHFCRDLCDRIPMYDLYFQKNDQFWDIITK